MIGSRRRLFGLVLFFSSHLAININETYNSCQEDCMLMQWRNNSSLKSCNISNCVIMLVLGTCGVPVT